MSDRKDVRREKLTQAPFCELRITDSCRRQASEATDVHEIVKRSQGGSVLDWPNLCSACSSCHQIVTSHPLFAECIGASLPSWVLRFDPEPAYILARALRQRWNAQGWEMPMELFWTEADWTDISASVESARRDAENH